MWKSSAKAGGGSESTWNPKHDPLMGDLHKTGRAGREFFEEGRRATQVCLCTSPN